jgi:RNA polymerase sigma-70 factor (ECF subfamily)
MTTGEPVSSGKPVPRREAMISDEDVEKAVEAMVRDHEPAIMGYLRGQMKLPYELAAEAFNDALLVMARKLRHGEPIDNPRAYMKVVAKNAAVDQLKMRYVNEIPSAELVQTTLGGDDMLDGVESTEVVLRAIRKLKPEYRQVVELRLLCDYSVADTATILAIPTGTVCSRLHTARQQLQELLRDEGIVRRSSRPRPTPLGGGTSDER